MTRLLRTSAAVSRAAASSNSAASGHDGSCKCRQGRPFTLPLHAADTSSTCSPLFQPAHQNTEGLRCKRGHHYPGGQLHQKPWPHDQRGVPRLEGQKVCVCAVCMWQPCHIVLCVPVGFACPGRVQNAVENNQSACHFSSPHANDAPVAKG